MKGYGGEGGSVGLARLARRWRRDRRRVAPGRRSFTGDVRAVSNVVGGLLFMAVVMVALINFRVGVVPMLDEKREASHMSVVGDRFALVKGESDRQVDGRSRAPVVTAVPLKAQTELGFTTDGLQPSYLVFEPDVRNVTMATSELLIQLDDDETVFGPEETWTNITATSTIENLTEVQHLRVRIEDPASEQEDDEVTVTVFDKDNVFAGDIRVYLREHPSGYAVNVLVRDADSDVLYDQGSSFFNQDQPPFYWVDGLADEVQFADVLRAAAPPFSLTFDRNGLSGAFTMVYLEETEAGTILVGGAGKTIDKWQMNVTGGALRYESHNVHFIRQDLSLEAGGIVVDQPVGNTFFVSPAMDVSMAGNRTLVRLTVPSLVGSGGLYSGYEPVAVRVQGLTRDSVVGTAPDFSFNVTTKHPDVWRTFWVERFEGLGLSAAEGNFSVVTGAEWARFDLFGPVASPSSSYHDLVLELHAGKVEVVAR